MRPRVIFVITKGGDDPEIALHRELKVVNFLMLTFPEHIFLTRASFIMLEMHHPRAPKEWGDFYVSLVQKCDALYCHEGYRAHPLADWASDLSMPLLDDPLDLELYLGTVEA